MVEKVHFTHIFEILTSWIILVLFWKGTGKVKENMVERFRDNFGTGSSGGFKQSRFVRPFILDSRPFFPIPDSNFTTLTT